MSMIGEKYIESFKNSVVSHTRNHLEKNTIETSLLLPSYLFDFFEINVKIDLYNKRFKEIDKFIKNVSEMYRM